MADRPPRPSRRDALRAAAALAAAPLAAGVAAAGLTPPEAKVADRPELSPIWARVRAGLFGERPIATVAPDGDALRLVAPSRAVDGAFVPVAFAARPARAGGRVARAWLVIDSNPSPIAAIVAFGPAAGGAALETRVRLDEYSHVRVVVEDDGGALRMASRFVKAAGGCSAPPGVDPKAALASLGRMGLQAVPPAADGAPGAAASFFADRPAVQLTVSHPNHSGMAIDQLTRLVVPAHFVRRVLVTRRGETVIDADLDFAISENPTLRFVLRPDAPAGAGELAVEASDSHERRFAQAFAVPSVVR